MLGNIKLKMLFVAILFAAGPVLAVNSVTINGVVHTCPDNNNLSVVNNEVTCTPVAAEQAETTSEPAPSANRITGQICKQHLNQGVLSQTWASLLTTQHDNESPRETPISELAAINVGVETSVGVRAMVEKMNEVIDGCERHCSGLRGSNGRLFNCERIGEANSNQLHAFATTDRHMADSAVTELTEDRLNALFEDQEDDEDDTQQVVVEERTDGYRLRDSLFEGQAPAQSTAVQF